MRSKRECRYLYPDAEHSTERERMGAPIRAVSTNQRRVNTYINIFFQAVFIIDIVVISSHSYIFQTI